MSSAIYAVSVVQNEADVIAESVAWAGRFCEHIWVRDLGSTDGTSDVLGPLISKRVTVETTPDTRFMSSLKGQVYNAHAGEIPDNSWIYILDADEFISGDPSDVLAKAENEGAAVVRAWQVNFYPSPADVDSLARLGEDRWVTIPLAERLRHYRVEWLEHRFIRKVPGLQWDTTGMHSRFATAHGGPLRISRHCTYVRHYRYRSPSQVARRYNTRTTSPVEGYGQFRYDNLTSFESIARYPRKCRRWPDGDETCRINPLDVFRARTTMLFHRLARRLSRHWRTR